MQCSGRNGTSGKRCGNRRGKNAGGVGSPSPRKLGVWKGDGKDLEEEEEEWYCHRHVGAILQNEGCYVGKVWVEFDGQLMLGTEGRMSWYTYEEASLTSSDA